MSIQLAEQILEHYNSYKNEILTKIVDFSYRKKRYSVDYTVALYMANASLDGTLIKNSIRDTDLAIKLDDNLYAVVFDFSKEEEGLKAAENLLVKIEPTLFGKKIFISVVNSIGIADDDGQIRKALNILVDEIHRHFDGVPMSVEEENIL